MRMLRRNTRPFQYMAYTGEAETMDGELHTGRYHATYGEPVTYRGSIAPPSGAAQAQLFGVNTQYTHVLLLDKPNADISEYGLVIYRGDEYEVKAVRPSLNVLSVALKKRTKNNDPLPPTQGGD